MGCDPTLPALRCHRSVVYKKINYRMASKSAFASGVCVVGVVLATSALHGQASAQEAPGVSLATETQALVDRYCVGCHNDRLQTANLSLDAFDATSPAEHPDVWEKVVTRLRAESMPPPGRPRPDSATYDAVAGWLEAELDQAWMTAPDPGRSAAVHRLNRTEYGNAIRDLLALNIDVTTLLPGDETADGSFDNFAEALTISKAHLERYLSVARHVTRLAVGVTPDRPAGDNFDIPLHVIQKDRQSEDLPFGSRGGMAIPYHFPVDGEYLVKVRLRRQYQDYITGMGWPQQLDVRLDGQLVKRFTIGGNAEGEPAASSYAGDGEPGFAADPRWEQFMQVTGDAHLEARIPVDAGPHIVGVSFVRDLWAPEGLPQPLQRGRVITNDQIYMDHASVGAVSIGGPFHTTGLGDTPSRSLIFSCQPPDRTEAADRACATEILTRLARRAYRRPVTSSDLASLLDFFWEGRVDSGSERRSSGEPGGAGSFDAGIQFALERMLVDPDFLLRVYRDPIDADGTVYALDDVELASRLSFFLWSSIPDDELLGLAEDGRLTDPEVLDAQVARLLADPRAVETLVNDFGAQWLNLRRVGDVVVDARRYPHYDENLLQGFVQETELFLASTVREDQSVRELLGADYTFVNERLAEHYGIPGVYGSRFRRVSLPDPAVRGGILAHGALLATTSYPDRTSPVLRGKWLLDNIFGIRVPPPPPGVDTNLDSQAGTPTSSIRERLALHRQSPTCATCHALIDPVGFALENFDVIGGWRTKDERGNPVDATGTTTSGATVEGLAGLRALLLKRPDSFPRTMTEKLLAYALGRPLAAHDQPAVRQIVREAAKDDYRWSSIVSGIVKSPAFLTRSLEQVTN